MGRELRVYFCPKCESSNVRYIFSLGNLFGIVPRQRCLSCGFESTTFPILVVDSKELNEIKEEVTNGGVSLRKRKTRKFKKKVKKKPIKRVKKVRERKKVKKRSRK